MKDIYTYLFKDVYGHRISSEARKKLDYMYYGHQYGEITFDAFKRIMDEVKPTSNDVFYDLGSGIGNTLILASLMAPFSKVSGIELFPELHNTAHSIISKYKTHIAHHIPHAKTQHLESIQGDFQSTPFNDATVIFINATCFRHEIQNDFLNRLAQIRPGSRVITSSYAIDHQDFALTNRDILPFSWGLEEVFIHRRT